jgi:hypothetical protein
MVTLKSVGITSITLASVRNFEDTNRRIILVGHKEEWSTNIVCSQSLSNKLRSCNTSRKFNNLMKKIINLPIGSGLELEACQ